MKKYLLLFSGVFLFSVCYLNGGNSEKLRELEKERSKLSVEMHNKRVELIKENPDLKEMHKKIMALHKELTLWLDQHEKMRELVERAKQLDMEIEKLSKKSESSAVKTTENSEEK